MQALIVLILIGATCCTAPSWAGVVFGTWKLNPARSTEPYPKGTTVRFEPHAKGEVFTLDRIAGDGRATTLSTLLYFDDKQREYQDPECSGTQSSRRVDSRTVEILRTCGSSEWTRFVRRLPEQPKELILDVTEQQANGRRLDRHLVLEKQQ